MKIIHYLLVLVVSAIVLLRCVTTSPAYKATEESKPMYNELVDYLRRVPGLQITGANGNYSIAVRGAVSLNASSEPLFIVDNVQVGSYQSAASLVDPNNIRSVEVLKDVASTQPYGMRGAGGVILIRTQKPK